MLSILLVLVFIISFKKYTSLCKGFFQFCTYQMTQNNGEAPMVMAAPASQSELTGTDTGTGPTRVTDKTQTQAAQQARAVKMLKEGNKNKDRDNANNRTLRQLMGWSHDRPWLFTASQWQDDLTQTTRAYLAYRAAACVTVLVHAIWYFAESKPQTPFYLTTYGIVFLLVYEMADLALVARHFKAQSEETSCLHRFVWVLYVLSSDFEVLITIFYWIFEYKAGKSHVT